MNLYKGQEPDYDSILGDLDYSSRGSLSDRFHNQMVSLTNELKALGCSKEFIRKVFMEAARRFIFPQESNQSLHDQEKNIKSPPVQRPAGEREVT